ncbi:hypothetical protein F5B20DRAFT_362693 [Whalleya microplaca]|nr:hypothetical protein F5B20DRAFT_362693 [Whalleya microplaca]
MISLLEVYRFLVSWGAARWNRLRSNRPSVDKQAGSRLLNLPTVALITILNHLPPESIAALSLTCKSAFYVLFPGTTTSLCGYSLENLLLLLEKDLSHRYFYCCDCGRLHRFSPSWAPYRRNGAQHWLELPCEPQIENSGDLCIGFHHARLVLNEHYFGPGRGLSLSQLEVKIASPNGGWEIQSEARIISGQLFLSMSHTLLLRGTRAENRHAISHSYPHEICHHVTTHYREYRNPHHTMRIPELLPLDGLICQPYGYFKECYNAPGSCFVCLTGFTTTIDRQVYSDVEHLNITIVSYHQLGDCWSPYDRTWLLFVAPPTMLTPFRPEAYENDCRGNSIIKRRWETRRLQITD